MKKQFNLTQKPWVFYTISDAKQTLANGKITVLKK
jgi:hypothetical protein